MSNISCEACGSTAMEPIKENTTYYQDNCGFKCYFCGHITIIRNKFGHKMPKLSKHNSVIQAQFNEF